MGQSLEVFETTVAYSRAPQVKVVANSCAPQVLQCFIIDWLWSHGAQWHVMRCVAFGPRGPMPEFVPNPSHGDEAVSGGDFPLQAFRKHLQLCATVGVPRPQIDESCGRPAYGFMPVLGANGCRSLLFERADTIADMLKSSPKRCHRVKAIARLRTQDKQHGNGDQSYASPALSRLRRFGHRFWHGHGSSFVAANNLLYMNAIISAWRDGHPADSAILYRSGWGCKESGGRRWPLRSEVLPAQARRVPTASCYRSSPLAQSLRSSSGSETVAAASRIFSNCS